MRRFGLVGHPLGHSFSKAYFTEKFAKERIDACYENFDLEDISEIRLLLDQHPDLKGFNVTIPYKEAVIPYLDEIDKTAEEVGAVNTVKVLDNGKLKGFNTDVVGIEESLSSLRAKRSNLKALRPKGENPHSSTVDCFVADAPRNDGGVNALILGTGGASKAVQYVLQKHNINFQLVSRDPEKGHFTYKTLTPETIKSHLLIINATPAGMAPNIDEAPEIPYGALTPQHVLFDLIYNPEETLFLRKGKEHGAQAINGLTMLYAQAEAAWSIWNS